MSGWHGRHCLGPIIAVVAASAIASMSGCAGTSLFTKKKAELEATAAQPIVNVLCLWQPAEGQGLNNKPSRGFDEQIMFFTRQHSAPVKADGEVTIFLFDDRGDEEAHKKPIHQFKFPSDAWQTHMVPGNLGPTYQLFIPYTRPDRFKSTCAIRVQLDPAQGPVAHSELSSVMLPGPEMTEKEQEHKSSGAEQTRNPAQIDNAASTKRSAAEETADKLLGRISAPQRPAASSNRRDAIELGNRRNADHAPFDGHAVGELHSGPGGRTSVTRLGAAPTVHPLTLSLPATTDAPMATSVADSAADAPRQIKLRAATSVEPGATDERQSHPLAGFGNDEEAEGVAMRSTPKRLSTDLTSNARALSEPHPLASRPRERAGDILQASHETEDDEFRSHDDSENPFADANSVDRRPRSTDRYNEQFEGVRNADWEIPAEE